MKRGLEVTNVKQRVGPLLAARLSQPVGPGPCLTRNGEPAVPERQGTDGGNTAGKGEGARSASHVQG